MSWKHALKEQLRASLPDLTAPGPGTAAVLVLIGRRPGQGEEEILLTKRTELVETHKGQISFPGGFWEAGDEDSLQTALRECEEEIGLIKQDIEVLGALPLVHTRGAVPIFPWVARTNFPAELLVSEGEVEQVLYLPLAQLLQEGLQPVTVEAKDYKVQSIGIRVSNELVWGATARVLQHLHEHLRKGRGL
ncbi:MAG: CoA pyrophosphatase [Bdellovibrionaceae bacterium]|nr:CoA pyrophosphatase [Bdellovibrionales bacterium]MCB9253439.1 CoA pyrophosphatase [Pseudobdellovibrionaceae bacterium]